MEKLIAICKPDVICSGIKDKFVIEKLGVPCKQLHSYDYGGPYAAFTGAANFYKEIDRLTSTKVWKFVIPPWKQSPELQATMAYGKPQDSDSDSKRIKIAKPTHKPAEEV